LLAHAVSRIALVKPDKARGVENMIISMAQRGQISEPVRAPLPTRAACFARDSWCGFVVARRCVDSLRVPPPSQVTDAQLLQMLEKVNEQMPKTGITVRVCLGSAAPCVVTSTVSLTQPFVLVFAHALVGGADQPPPPGDVRGRLACACARAAPAFATLRRAAANSLDE
jgi:hypothetical protein